MIIKYFDSYQEILSNYVLRTSFISLKRIDKFEVCMRLISPIEILIVVKCHGNERISLLI